MRKSCVTYETVESILLKNSKDGGPRLVTREIRDLLGGHGSLSKISMFMKQFYDTNQVSGALANDNIQEYIVKFSNLLKEAIQRSTSDLASELSKSDESVRLGLKEIEEFEETIETLKGDLAEREEKLRMAEAKLALLEDSLAEVKTELATDRAKSQETLQEALKEASFYRGKYEALSGKVDYGEPTGAIETRPEVEPKTPAQAKAVTRTRKILSPLSGTSTGETREKTRTAP